LDDAVVGDEEDFLTMGIEEYICKWTFDKRRGGEGKWYGVFPIGRTQDALELLLDDHPMLASFDPGVGCEHRKATRPSPKQNMIPVSPSLAQLFLAHLNPRNQAETTHTFRMPLQSPTYDLVRHADVDTLEREAREHQLEDEQEDDVHRPAHALLF
jgi:hypothetical protein